MKKFREMYKDENPCLYLIRKYGTEKDKNQLRGSGHMGNRPLSKEFYQKLKKNKESM